MVLYTFDEIKSAKGRVKIKFSELYKYRVHNASERSS